MDQLTTQKGLKFKNKNPERFYFEPKELLINLVTMYANMAHLEKFRENVIPDARSYSDETFAKAVKDTPDRPELRAYLGISYERRGLNAEAIEQLEAAWKLDPKNKDYLDHLAALYEQTGKMQEALMAYEKILVLDPDDSEAQENYLRLKMQEIGQ